jgi:2-phosphosulfolactate phosphatase
MDYFDQGPFDIRCEWGIGGIEQIASSEIIIVVDVLSFSTTVDVALGVGATVFPYRWKDESVAAYAGERSAVVAGRRGEAPYSLAPSSLVDAPPGLRLVLPSPNGSSLAFAAMNRGAVVVAGCLRNASAIAAWARRKAKRITVVPAGERWPDGSLRPAFEDLLGAGAIVKQLGGRRSSEAEAAAAVFDCFSSCVLNGLLGCSSGRELFGQGFMWDLDLAADVDASTIVPMLEGEAFVPAGSA